VGGFLGKRRSLNHYRKGMQGNDGTGG